MVAIGEVGLAGEIRGVTGIARRLAEAERMGFRRAIVPPGSGYIPPGAAGPGPRRLAVAGDPASGARRPRAG